MAGILDPTRKELLLEWMDARSEAFTIAETATAMGVHYQTAWLWFDTLRESGLIERDGKRGNADTYVRCVSLAETEMTRAQRAIRIAHGGKHLTIADWVAANLSDSNVAASAHALAYLLIRSYYADAVDHQHLRGSIPAVEVRAFVARCVAAIKEDVHVLEQLLGFRGPWVEGSEFALRFGDLPVGTTLLSLQERAAFFSNTVNPPPKPVVEDGGEELWTEADEGSQSPPVDAPVPGRSLTELLEEAGKPDAGE